MCHKLKESALPYHSRVGGKGLARRVISGKGGDPIRLATRKYPARGMAKQQAQLGFFFAARHRHNLCGRAWLQ